MSNAKRLILVTGKGGAGKSVIAAALALHHAKQGKKVWLAEIGRKAESSFSRLPSLLDVPRITHDPTKITLVPDASFLASTLEPAASLAEYVGLKLSVGRVSSLVLKNRVTGSLLEIVPGLPELVTIGKIWYALTQAKKDDQPDTVIIDGPASGHAVTLLHAPKNFARLTRAGPLYKDAMAMMDFLQDKSAAEIHLTALPEEMALKETEEHYEILKKEFAVNRVWVNKCFPEIPKVPDVPKFYQATYEYSRHRYEREAESMEKFQSSFQSGVLQQIPFLFPEAKGPILPVRLERELP